ncbi:MAG: hypothetical protein ACTSU7_09330 [Candidatus Heimdallarchaeaceae archaeon]
MSKEPTFSVYSSLLEANSATGFKTKESALFYIKHFHCRKEASQMRVIEEKAKK